MKKEIKNPGTSLENTISKQRKCNASVVKSILLTKIQVSKKLKKNRFMH